MHKTEEIFLKYPNKRDVVFVLGAGASQPDGIPLQRFMLPKILSGEIEEISKSEIGNKVISFIKDNFTYESSLHQYPQLEAVFGFLDYFIQQSESLNQKYPYSEIVTIREYLIKLIYYIVNFKTDKHSKYYHKFWQGIQKHNNNISIVTLNYDTLLEQSFEFLFKHFGYIDYCLPLMNYEKTDKLKPFNFWINPREPVHIEQNEEPVSIKIIKVHGSLNWKYCNCCNQLLLTPWDRMIDLKKGKFLGYTYPDLKEYEYVCPLDGTDFQTLIMPPSYVKTLNHPIVSQLLIEAAREIRNTKKIVFVGYSLSDADVHIKALFKKQLREDVKVYVINSRITDNLKRKYLSLTKKIKFIESPFETMVFNEELISELLDF